MYNTESLNVRTKTEKFLLPAVAIGEVFVAFIFGTFAFILWIFKNFSISTVTVDSVSVILSVAIFLVFPLLAIYFLIMVFSGKRQITQSISSTIYAISIPFIFFIWSFYLALIIPRFADVQFSLLDLSLLEQLIFVYAIVALFRLLLLFFLAKPLKLKPPILTPKIIHPLIILFALGFGFLTFFFESGGLAISFIKAFAVSSFVLYTFTEFQELVT